jgi:hypothetical protein
VRRKVLNEITNERDIEEARYSISRANEIVLNFFFVWSLDLKKVWLSRCVIKFEGRVKLKRKGYIEKKEQDGGISRETQHK